MLLVLCGLAAGEAVAQPDPPTAGDEGLLCDEAHYKETLRDLRAEIEQQIPDPRAGRVEWCRILGLGDGRIVYSTWQTDEWHVEELAAVYREILAEYRDACIPPRPRTRPIPPPPLLELINGRCVITRN
ncbi:MAG: hypothetical protein AAGI91_14645 [Bacteroidota bacterium]